MGQRCCGNDIYGPLLRLPGPAEPHRCPIVALRSGGRCGPEAGGPGSGMPETGGVNGRDREPGRRAPGPTVRDANALYGPDYHVLLAQPDRGVRQVDEALLVLEQFL